MISHSRSNQTVGFTIARIGANTAKQSRAVFQLPSSRLMDETLIQYSLKILKPILKQMIN